MMRTAVTIAATIALTLYHGLRILWAAVRKVPPRDGTVYDRLPRQWARGVLRASGSSVAVHGAEKLAGRAPRIFVSNHVSWFDVPALAAVLPRYKFVAKAELLRVPLFGPAAHASVMIPIERENRKAAFRSYDAAADEIRAGSSVVVYPEGTRGRDYTIRPFKKGPFVLAINAGVPVVPVIIHGTIEIMPKGSLRIRRGRIDVHILDEIETAGMTYDERARLTERVWRAMADAMRAHYGVDSRPAAVAPTPALTPDG